MELVRGSLYIKILIWLLLATTSLYICSGTSWSWDWETEEELVEERIFNCKDETERCYGFPRCCGTLSCYWTGGYSPFRPGRCVICIDEGRACQNDKSCCVGLVCDSADRLNVNGNCLTPRTFGSCFRRAQCRYTCKQAYFKNLGYCTESPPIQVAVIAHEDD